MRRDLDRDRRSVVVPEWAVVHSEVSCSDWLLVSLAALWDLNIFLQKSFLPRRAPGICSSLQGKRTVYRQKGHPPEKKVMTKGGSNAKDSTRSPTLGKDTMVGLDEDGAIWGEHSLFGGLGGSTGDVAATLICSTGYLTLLPGHTQLWPAHRHTHQHIWPRGILPLNICPLGLNIWLYFFIFCRFADVLW